MEFPLILPTEIYKAKGSKGHTPHVMQSPFAALKRSNNGNGNANSSSNNNNNNTGARQNHFESFNVFNGYNENDEVLPHEEVPPEPLMPGPELDGLVAPPGLDGNISRSAFGAPKARRSPLVLWTPSRNVSGLTAQAISESRFNRWYYLATLRTFGFDYLKPPGITKTLKTMLEEEEMSDVGEDSLEMDHGLEGMDGAVEEVAVEEDAGAPLDAPAEEGEFEDAREGEAEAAEARPDEEMEDDGEVDLDAEIQEAEEFNYDYSDDEYDEGEYEGPLFEADDYQQDELEAPEVHRTPHARASMTPANASFVRHTPRAHDDDFSFEEDEERSFFYNTSHDYSRSSFRGHHGHVPSASAHGRVVPQDGSSVEFDFSSSTNTFNHIAESTARSLPPVHFGSANNSIEVEGMVGSSTREDIIQPLPLPPVRYSRPSLVSVPPLGPPPLRQSSGMHSETPYSLSSQAGSLTPPLVLTAAAAAAAAAAGNGAGAAANDAPRRSSRRISNRYDSEYGIGPESPETPGRTPQPPGAAISRRFSRIFFANNPHGARPDDDHDDDDDDNNSAAWSRGGSWDRSSATPDGAGNTEIAEAGAAGAGANSSTGNGSSIIVTAAQSTPILGASSSRILPDHEQHSSEESDMSMGD